MFIADNYLFIDANNHIKFDKLILKFYNKSIDYLEKSISIIPIMNISRKRLTFDIIDAHNTYDNDFEKITFTDSVEENKMIYLNAIKKIINTIYNNIILYKKYNVRFFNKLSNIIIGYDNHFGVYRRYDKNYMFANTEKSILVLIKQSDDTNYDLEIKDNTIQYILSGSRRVVYYPYNLGFSMIIDTKYQEVDFLNTLDCLIVKDTSISPRIEIRSDIEPSLLQLFFEYFDVFKKIDRFEISNKHDLLKYL